ncbi:SDR family NAD(P)-dependent oxidoreductase [Paenibacillus donghaensis]|uniref:Short-chain dehydrogenase n=1 Tax=Paenibacillus donghaensis TaxID=414771 RepID=A0A2Z2KHF8_9BACL|nr:SDR family NAD(P)-dependent oxidoreductase [Paenibacillus donghaensis]ASA21609.1 hypothetical protein B9T62_13015 [Paenibacillus donghaensis]
MKTIVIIGAGPGLGLSLAKKFGGNGFNVAAISRNSTKLEIIVSELQKLKIEAKSYATNLHSELKEKGIYVGHLSIGNLIQAGTDGDPDLIAKAWCDLYEKKDRFEETFPMG